MPTFTCFEHERFPLGTFTPTDRHLTLIDRLKTHQGKPLIKIGRNNSLHATHHVGILRIANLTLQILPKIHRTTTADPTIQREEATQNLLAMLAYAHDLPLHHRAAPIRHREHDWFELLTRLFATQLREQLHAAPHRAYHSFDDDLPLLRGKLRIADQLRRPDRQHRFACTFDEFSIDNPLNRIFRFVTERLFFQTASSTNRQLLSELRTLLDDVPLPTHCTPADADPAKLLSRLNRRYGPTLELARLFLSNAAPHLTPGPSETINFLFDMNQLFEQFLVAFLQKHRTQVLANTPLADASLVVQSRNHRIHLASERDSPRRKHFRLHPDIYFKQANTCRLILDTKYKSLNPRHRRLGTLPADFYQMFAYAHQFKCKNVLLLYPRTAEMPEDLCKTFRVENTDIQITAATLNLTQDLYKNSGPNALIKDLHDLFVNSPVALASRQ